MPKGYHHVTRDERSKIEGLISINISFRKIAKQLSLDVSTISREVKKNSTLLYNVEEADKMAKARQASIRTSSKKLCGDLLDRVNKDLQEDWSPEQIAGRLKYENNSELGFVSFKTIYRHIHKDTANNGNLYKHLRHGKKKYRKTSKKEAGLKCIPNRVDIDKRPEIVDLKKRIGDWEGDTIISTCSKAAIVTLVERFSKLAKIKKIGQKTAKKTNNAITKLLKGIVALSITFDNGKEFSWHEKLTKVLNLAIYFAKPYHSWERGLNEHTNGLIRQYLPKNFDFKDVSNKRIKEIEDKLNNRPRKSLGFKTPLEVYTSEAQKNCQFQMIFENPWKHEEAT